MTKRKRRCSARKRLPYGGGFHICRRERGHAGRHQCGNWIGCKHRWIAKRKGKP